MSGYGYVTEHEAKVRPMNEELFKKEVSDIKDIYNQIIGNTPTTAPQEEPVQKPVEEPVKEEPKKETPVVEEPVKQPENPPAENVSKEVHDSVVVDGVTYVRSETQTSSEEKV